MTPVPPRSERQSPAGEQPSLERYDGTEIAIIGMACRLPGANDIEQFWHNLCRGVEALVQLSDQDLAAAGVPAAVAHGANYVRSVPVLDQVEMFDAGFFGYTPLEARLMDPQHRLFLECAWEAFERAGYDPQRCGGRAGVFTGAKTNTYLFSLFSDRELFGSLDSFQIALGGDLAAMATRVSYKLDLRGPSYALHTACSTSLVAIHLACQSLLLGECRVALAGGAAINVPHRRGYPYQKGGILSPDGSCRTFDARAAGSNFGNGVGAVLLKRLEDALADGDHIHALIRGSATNNDGAAKASYTAPGVEGQTEVLLEAMASAGIEASSLSYIEAHGTATELGDAIEMLALANAFKAAGWGRAGDGSAPARCAIGSVKTNLGHLETAAGVAGVIKTALALEHRQIPASLHFEHPNPRIDFASSPFYVNTQLADWPAGAAPRRAGVSSFGIGSTNAHAILEEAPAPLPPAPCRPGQLLVLSARTAGALDVASANLARYLEAQPDLDGPALADVAYTLSVGRREFAHRRALVCAGAARDAAAALAALDPAQVLSHVREGEPRAVAFLLPGLGEHYAGMARGLYDGDDGDGGEPVFRAALDRCAQQLQPLLGLDIRQALFPPAGAGGSAAGAGGFDLRRMVGRGEGAPAAGEPVADVPLDLPLPLDQTQVAQPALFAVEYALAQLWIAWGIQPRALVGYSLGEYVAACLAGVLALPDALRLVAGRARLIAELPPGGMLAVALDQGELAPLLTRHGLSLAAVNGPGGCVAAGGPAAIEGLAQELAGRGVACRRLPTTHPFHAAELAPLAAPLTDLARSLPLAAPRIPYLSNVTGTWITAQQATDPGYWAQHMCQPVRFGDAVGRLLAEGRWCLLEVGPGQGLGSFVRQHPACDDAAAQAVFASLGNANSREADRQVLLRTLGKLWLSGQPVAWPAYWKPEARRRRPLPTYPFERQRYWVDPPRADWGAGAAPGAGVAGAAPGAAVSVPPAAQAQDQPAGLRVTLDKQPDPADWLYQPVWRQTPSLAGDPPQAQAAVWLVLGGSAGSAALDDSGGDGVLAVAIAARLSEAGYPFLVVSAAPAGTAAGAAAPTPHPAASGAAPGGAVLPPAGATADAIAAGRWAIDPADPAHYDALLAVAERLAAAAGGAASGGGVMPLNVLHLWNAGAAPAGADSHDRLQDVGFFSLLFLAQALGRRRNGAPARIVVVSTELQRVEDGDRVVPDKAPLLGPCRVIPQEIAGVRCRSVDLAPAALADAAALGELAGRLVQEAVDCAAPDAATVVAYRGGVRWLQDFAAVRPAAPAATPIPDAPGRAAGGGVAIRLRERGVYLLTGGLGGIGLAMAEHLAGTVGARLVLTGRSPVPPREEWDGWLAAHPAEDRVSGRLVRLRRLEELGAEVMAVAADAADLEQMRAVVAAARRRFGAIHGVIHLAGIPGGGIVQLKTRAAAARIMAPKVAGARVLEALFGRPGELDFLALFSSIAAQLGEFGQADYCGANAYLDGVAQRNAARGWPVTVTVDSDIWREVGLAVTTEVPAHLRGWRQEMLAQALAPAEGADAFFRALGCGVPQVVISAQPLAARIALGRSWTAESFLAQFARGAAAAPAAMAGAPAPALVPGGAAAEPASISAAGGPAGGPAPVARRVLGTAFAGAGSDRERRVAAIWQRLLGLEQVGVHDNFFDLGGNSLIGLQVVSEIGRELGIQVAPVTLFESPTVAGLARHLAREAGDMGDGAEDVLGTSAAAVAAVVAERRRRLRAGEGEAARGGHDIAILGMSGRFPGAPSVEDLWRNLRAGVESVVFFSDQELAAAGVSSALAADPRYVRAGSVLDGIDLFDAGLFGFSPREAEVTDPQHRVFLECAWEVLERAGYDPATYPGAIGVFAGSNLSTYLLGMHADPQVRGAVNMLQAILGNDKDSLTTTVSYKLNLRGPSVAVQTFCSTSLVAVHMACRSLRGGECDMALAGGVRIVTPDRQGYLYEQGGMAPADGHTRSFDARADGSVLGHGAGIVCLKRLADALADGDPVIAVIKGSAINNDGAVKAGYTAPSVEGQAEAIAAAFEDAGVDPASVGYVEAHGSATALGDPIEIAALTRAFRPAAPPAAGCPIGSVKSNLGHLDRAAGVTGLIKTALALAHGEIPPSLNFAAPNPQIDFAATPFFVNTELRPWPRGAAPRRAAVNSLGMGGTNVHLVVEEAPPPAPAAPGRPWQLLVLSAKTPGALAAATDNLRHWLDAHPALGAAGLADAAFTLQVGRRALGRRRVLVCSDAADAAQALAAGEPGRLLSADCDDRTRSVVFAFAGLGGQYVDMGRGLYDGEPTFRAVVDACAEMLVPILGRDLRPLLYPPRPAGSAADASGAIDRSNGGLGAGTPPAGSGGAGNGVVAGNGSAGNVQTGRSATAGATAAAPIDLRRMLGRSGAAANSGAGGAAGATAGGDSAGWLEDTRLVQPALFVVEYALARLYMEWGIRPQAVVGYSLGEYVAACVAGVLSLPDALKLVAGRARLIAELPAGAMLAVALPAAELAPLLDGDLSLAAINGPAQSVAAGAPQAVAALEQRLAALEVASRRLPVAHAFHARSMEAAFEPMAALAAGVELRPAAIPCLSNVTGGWLTPEEATDPTYWARHMCQPVRFSDAIAALRREPDRIVVEIGPGASLRSLILQHPAGSDVAGSAVDATGAAAPAGAAGASVGAAGAGSAGFGATAAVDAAGSTGVAGRDAVDASGTGEIVLATLRHAYEALPDQQMALATLGRLWLLGVQPDWPGLYRHEGRRRVLLPTYPFERRRYWIDAAIPGSQARPAADRLAAAGALGDPAQAGAWLYLPSWRRLPLAAAAGLGTDPDGGSTWLLLADDGSFGHRLAERLKRAGRRVARARRRLPSANGAPAPAGVYDIHPGAPGASAALLDALAEVPGKVLHLWGADGDDAETAAAAGAAALVDLAREMAARAGDGAAARPAGIWTVTGQAQAVESGEAVCPAAAPAAGLRGAITRWLPWATCRAIDLRVPAAEAARERLVDQLVAELAGSAADALVAYRGRHRWVATVEPLADAAAADGPVAGPLSGEQVVSGPCLIVGGLGEVGFPFAAYLARQPQARLALLEPSGLPERRQWDEWLAGPAGGGVVARRIRRALRLEEMGAQLLVASGDAAEAAVALDLAARAERLWGPLGMVVGAVTPRPGAAGVDAGGDEGDDGADGGAALAAGMGQLRVLDQVGRRSGAALVWLVTAAADTALRLYAAALAESATAAGADDGDGDGGDAVAWTSIAWGLADAAGNGESRAGGLGSHAGAAVHGGNGAHAGNGARPANGVQPGDAAQDGDPGALALDAIARLHRAAGTVTQVLVASRPLPMDWSPLDALPRAAAAPQGAPDGPRAGGPGAGFYPRPSLRVAYAPPQSETEIFIAGIWEELLGVARVGVHDNFLDLGGDSLLATRLAARMRGAIGFELPVRLFFEHSTVAALAAAVDDLGRRHVSSESREMEEQIEGLSEEEVEMEILRLEQSLASGEEAAHG